VVKLGSDSRQKALKGGVWERVSLSQSQWARVWGGTKFLLKNVIVFVYTSDKK